MSQRERWRRGLLPGLVGLVVGLAAGLSLGGWLPRATHSPQVPGTPDTYRPELPPYRGLDANLYMQTAAEYRACCYQAYNLATLRLRERVKTVKPDGKKLAVVLDLDETVLDNAGFEALLVRKGLAYDQRLWDAWEERHAQDVGLIPGAREFIREAGRLGVKVIYISNRSEKYHAADAAALEHLGIPVKPDELRLLTSTGDKTQRRAEVEKDYAVLLYAGDNLRDFDERFRSKVNNAREKTRTTDPAGQAAAIRQRKDEVDRTREKWGDEWIILPNPSYGEWTSPLGLGERDLDQLAPSPPDLP
jgi:acid phosphatase